MRECKHPTCGLTCRRTKIEIIKTPLKKRQAKDLKLWKVFSLFIRLRDADTEGICTCFTCGRKTVWNKNTDCGHGIPRQHFATKYNEKNNHAQCKKCNGFEGGMREKYKEEMNRRYGSDTWDLMMVLASKPSKVSQFEVDVLEKYYIEQVKLLKQEKGL